jgi:hypothetical protein
VLCHVALVSQTTEVSLAEISKVAAAIQKQISRDFSPIWRVDATVNAFDKLEDVPLGYWHLILEDEIPSGLAGLHKREDNGQPFALVALSLNWPVFMSHEVLEMLVDPDGTRTVAGDSQKPGQGRVEFLVEVCDPSQSSSLAYSVNGIMVSDFYTPQYFEPVVSTGVRYSYSGKIKQPREVLDGGYSRWTGRRGQLSIKARSRRIWPCARFPTELPSADAKRSNRAQRDGACFSTHNSISAIAGVDAMWGAPQD